jgi:hypothetical protein
VAKGNNESCWYCGEHGVHRWYCEETIDRYFGLLAAGVVVLIAGVATGAKQVSYPGLALWLLAVDTLIGLALLKGRPMRSAPEDLESTPRRRSQDA